MGEPHIPESTCGCGCGRRIFTGMYAYRIAGQWFAQGCVRLYPVAALPADENEGANLDPA